MSELTLGKGIKLKCVVAPVGSPEEIWREIYERSNYGPNHREKKKRRYPLYAIFLYSLIDPKILDYMNKYVDDLDAVSGRNCLVFSMKEPVKSYEIVDELQDAGYDIEPKDLPCFIFFQSSMLNKTDLVTSFDNWRAEIESKEMAEEPDFAIVKLGGGYFTGDLEIFIRELFSEISISPTINRIHGFCTKKKVKLCFKKIKDGLPTLVNSLMKGASMEYPI